jgi:hypothetical protein
MNWVPRQSGTANQLSGVAYGDGHFVTVGPGGNILQSGSVIQLEIAPSATAGLLTLAVTGPSGTGYTFQSSSDLVSWRTLTNITSVLATTVISTPLPPTSGQVFFRAYSQ